MKEIKVCCCDGMPGIHNYSTGCNTEEGFVQFTPSKEDLEFQNICKHKNENSNDEAYKEIQNVFEGICNMCGKVINKKDALKWQKKETKFPKLKKFLMTRKNRSVSTNTFHIDSENKSETVFMGTESVDNKFFLECSNCNEELGEVSDKNISHQCEAHSCATE